MNLRLFFLIQIIMNLFIFSVSPIYSQATRESVLLKYDFGHNKPKQILLPEKLHEISGLVFTGDQKLFTHDDERGIVYQIDLESNDIVKRFFFGYLVKKGDFEGIAGAGDTLYLTTSKGQIVELQEGRDKESVDYHVYHSGLSKKYNVEGLCYDPKTGSLLLACKEYPGKGYKGYRAVYSFSLKEKRLSENPRFLINRDSVESFLDIDDFKPSGIVRYPATGTFLILSARENALIEISEKGHILGMVKLRDKWHEQPEGIEITADLSLLISDEGRKNGMISIYELKR